MNKQNDLWQAITALFILLQDESNTESDYQRFFESHPIAFTAIGVERAASFEKRSGNQLPLDPNMEIIPEPDFLGINCSKKELSVIELKTPFVGRITTSRSDGNRANFKATAGQYLSQATEYVRSIQGSERARDTVKSVLRIENIPAYNIILLYGLSNDNDRQLVTTLCAERSIPTEIVFYDDLLNALADTYAYNRPDAVERKGMCIVLRLCIPQEQKHNKSWLGEIGNEDRISIILNENRLNFECTSMDGTVNRLSAGIEFGRMHYIRFEFSNDENGMYMSLCVDNVEQSLRHERIPFDFNPDVFTFNLGADSKGNNGTEFYITEHSISGFTFGIRSKLISYRDHVNAISHTYKVLHFFPETYMTICPEGSFFQATEEFRPIYDGTFQPESP
ncbi:MAG: DUF4263 domain-containing protein [Planctomycetaceae bacterium]